MVMGVFYQCLVCVLFTSYIFLVNSNLIKVEVILLTHVDAIYVFELFNVKIPLLLFLLLDFVVTFRFEFA